MLSSFYLFIIPFLVVCFYVIYKFIINKAKIEKMEKNAFMQEKLEENNLEQAKEIVLSFVENLKEFTSNFLNLFFHWILHFIVIFLKFISTLTDTFYISSRDFFLKTATKEKNAVSLFWHHLKEYKKEKEEEKKD